MQKKTPQIIVDGAFLPASAPVITVSDRSFRYGDGLFETIRVTQGLPYLFHYHLERLTLGMQALSIFGDLSVILRQALMLIQANEMTEGLLRIHVSRGAGSRGYLPHNARAMILLETLERPPLPESAKLWLSGYRRIAPDALPTQFKLAQGMGSTLARLQAQQNGCDEALQLAHDGSIAEASAANIFWLMGDTLYTPALSTGALAGITRRRVMELSPYPVRQGHFTLDDLGAAREVFLTNSACAITPVTALMNHRFSWDKKSLSMEFNDMINKDITKDLSQLRVSLA